jgi:hypothetical protein
MICAGCELTAEGTGPGSFRKLTWYGGKLAGTECGISRPRGSNSFAVVTFTPVGRMIAYLPFEALFFAGTSPAILRRIKSCQLSSLP